MSGRRTGRSASTSACWPAGTTRRGRRRWSSASLGDGRVLLWTTTADRAGQRLADRAELRPGRARGRPRTGAADPLRHTRSPAGERMRRVVRSSQQVANARVDSSRRRRAASTRRSCRSDEPGRPRTRPSRSTSPTRARPGLYRHRLGRRPAGDPARPASRPTPTRARASSSGSAAADLKSMFEPLEIEIAVRARAMAPTLFAATGREVWRAGVAAVCSF